MLRRVLPFALLLAPLTGCIVIELPDDLSFEPDFDPSFEGEDTWTDEGAPLRGNGRVRGDLGPVRGFDGRADDLQGATDAYWSSITVTAYDDDGRMGMLIIDIEGDVRSLASGTYRYSSSGVDGPTSVSGMYVTGCSSTDDTSYDAPSEEGVIIVDNDGDDCVVEVEADLPSDDLSITTTATATFTLE